MATFVQIELSIEYQRPQGIALVICIWRRAQKQNRSTLQRQNPPRSACKDQCADGKAVGSQREGRVACARTKERINDQS